MGGKNKKSKIVAQAPEAAAVSKQPAKAVDYDALKANVHIAAFLMVKNEEKRIRVSLESVKNVIKSLVIFDTGSTDNTIAVIREWCEQNRIPLRLKEGTFVDFSTSRNEGLSFAYGFDDIEFLLLLDSNDELHSHVELLELCNYAKNNKIPQTGFSLTQKWFHGTGTTIYQNVRMIVPRKNWWYKGVVHEWLNRYVDGTKSDEVIEANNLLRTPQIVIYQDRVADEGKSGPRFAKDKELLLREIQRDPSDSRSMFYLAQSCECLGQSEDALYYYRLRSMMNGYEDERFHAFLRGGDNAAKLGHDVWDVMKWYLKAYNHSKRAEPLVRIANIFMAMKDFKTATMFAREACQLDLPDHLLFVDHKCYEYERYHKMGIAAYYAGDLAHGAIACTKAIAQNVHRELDENNLKFYNEKLAEVARANRNAFMEAKVKLLLSSVPAMKYEDAVKVAAAEHERLIKK